MTPSSGESLDTIAGDIVTRAIAALIADVGSIDSGSVKDHGDRLQLTTLGAVREWLENVGYGAEVDEGDTLADLVAARLRELIGPRTVTTAEELNALPVGTIILDKWRNGWLRKDAGVWWLHWSGESNHSRELAQDHGPFTVGYEPVVTG